MDAAPDRRDGHRPDDLPRDCLRTRARLIDEVVERYPMRDHAGGGEPGAGAAAPGGEVHDQPAGDRRRRQGADGVGRRGLHEQASARAAVSRRARGAVHAAVSRRRKGSSTSGGSCWGRTRTSTCRHGRRCRAPLPARALYNTPHERGRHPRDVYPLLHGARSTCASRAHRWCRTATRRCCSRARGWCRSSRTSWGWPSRRRRGCARCRSASGRRTSRRWATTAT